MIYWYFQKSNLKWTLVFRLVLYKPNEHTFYDPIKTYLLSGTISKNTHPILQDHCKRWHLSLINNFVSWYFWKHCYGVPEKDSPRLMAAGTGGVPVINDLSSLSGAGGHSEGDLMIQT